MPGPSPASATDPAAGPEMAESFYNQLCMELEHAGLQVARGVFRAHMQVSLVNDGPVTILLDSRKQF